MEATAREDGERIARRMARAGLCSRREAERWIADGRVVVDGVVVTTPALRIGADARLTVDGALVEAPERTRLWRYHKPRGLICTSRDPQGRATVFDRLPADLPRVVTIGRLDLNSEGLLLLTNDGALARRLELPATGWLRRYRVRAFGRIDEAKLARLARGTTVGGVRYGPIDARLERAQGANAWLNVGLREGKNREVRHVMEHLGLTVSRLIRVRFGSQHLSRDLRSGRFRRLSPQAVQQLVADAGLPGSAAGAHAELRVEREQPRRRRR